MCGNATRIATMIIQLNTATKFESMWRPGLALGSELGYNVRSEVCKLRMPDFDILQRIFACAESGKSRVYLHHICAGKSGP